METLNRIAALLPRACSDRLLSEADNLREVRLRAGRPIQLVGGDEDTLIGDAVSLQTIQRALASLMDYSVYAREAELSRGFFTTRDGCRVGACGRMSGAGGEASMMTAVGSICIRIAREVKGCAEALMPHMLAEGFPRSTLIVSPPGLGKTTLLRDIARRLSEEGFRIVIADERHELAACHMGVPTLDVGARTDVMDGGAKPDAILRMIRAMSPDVIVTDEIGGVGDASALSEARRCGVCVVASAHASSLEVLYKRRCMMEVLSGGVFDLAALLGGEPGRIVEIRRLTGDGTGSLLWKCA